MLSDALVDAHAERARLTGAEGVHVCPGRGEARDDRLGVSEQQLSRLGERHLARPPGALDELLADDPLEGRDLLADRRLGVAERDRRAAERRLTRDGLQRDQVAKLDPEPTIRVHDGKVPKHDWCLWKPMPILGVMELVILAFLLLIGPLAVRYGADSRVTDTRERRGPWRTG